MRENFVSLKELVLCTGIGVNGLWKITDKMKRSLKYSRVHITQIFNPLSANFSGASINVKPGCVEIGSDDGDDGNSSGLFLISIQIAIIW